MSSAPSASTRGAGVVMVGIFASRLMGLVREQVVALYFGRSGELSAFWAAFKVPNFFRVLLGEGNLSASFIPILSGQLARGDALASRRTADALLGVLLVGVAVFTALGILLAPVLATVVAPGFDDPLRELVARLIRILFPLAAFLILGAWCMGVLHAHGRFFWPNFAPVFLSLVSALSLLLLVDSWRRRQASPIELLAWGTLAGGLVQLLVQLPESARVLKGLRPRLDWSDPGLRRVLVLFAPLLLGTGVAQINSVIETQIASFLDPEAVSTLQYALRLYTLPLSLFGTSVAMVALPALARDSASAGDASGLATTRDLSAVGGGLSDAWLRALFFLVPSSAALVGFGEPLVRLLFERGAFTAEDTVAVTRVVALYALGLVAFASVRIFAQAFYALEDSRTPTRLSIVALAINTVLSVVLAWRLGTPGIALASSVAAFVSAALLARTLTRRLGTDWLARSARDIGKLAAAGVAAAAAGGLAAGSLGAGSQAPSLGERLLHVLVPYAAIGAVYLLVARALGVLPMGPGRFRLPRRG